MCQEKLRTFFFLQKWEPMVSFIQEENELNVLALEDLTCFLLIHEIEFNEDEPKRRPTFISLKSKCKNFKCRDAKNTTGVHTLEIIT